MKPSGRALQLLVAVMSAALATSGCELEMTSRELRLDARQLRVTVENRSGEPRSLIFRSQGHSIPPFTTTTWNFEAEGGIPRWEHQLNPTRKAWSVELGRPVSGPDGGQIGIRGPFVVIASGFEPLVDTAAELLVVIEDEGVRWRATVPEQ